MSIVERNSQGRFERVSPATVARKQRDAKSAREALAACREINARRERVRRTIGPLTRAELSAGR